MTAPINWLLLGVFLGPQGWQLGVVPLWPLPLDALHGSLHRHRGPATAGSGTPTPCCPGRDSICCALRTGGITHGAERARSTPKSAPARPGAGALPFCVPRPATTAQRATSGLQPLTICPPFGCSTCPAMYELSAQARNT